MLTRAELSKAGAEMIATFALVFFGCGSVVASKQYDGVLPPSGVAIVFGLVVATMIPAVGHISGAHFNPAVTLGFAVARRFPARQVLIYWTAQAAGAVAAACVLSALFPTATALGATVPTVPAWHVLTWEALLTFF
jgi:aquaporin Z